MKATLHTQKAKHYLVVKGLIIFTLFISACSKKDSEPAKEFQTDVYVIGYERKSPETYNTTAKVWKNGVATDFKSYSASLNSIYVTNNDIYIAGSDSWHDEYHVHMESIAKWHPYQPYRWQQSLCGSFCICIKP